MPISEKLLEIGRQFDSEVDTLIDDDDEKKKKKGKVSQRLLDVGKRIEFIDKSLRSKEEKKIEGKPTAIPDKEYVGVTKPEYIPDYDSLGATREERLTRSREQLGLKEAPPDTTKTVLSPEFLTKKTFNQPMSWIPEEFAGLSDDVKKYMQQQGVKRGLPLEEEQPSIDTEGRITKKQFSPYERQVKRLEQYVKEEEPKLIQFRNNYEKEVQRLNRQGEELSKEKNNLTTKKAVGEYNQKVNLYNSELEKLPDIKEYDNQLKKFDSLYKSVEQGFKRREENLKKIEELKKKSSKGEISGIESQELLELQKTEAVSVEGADISKIGHALRSFYNVFPHQVGDFIKALGILKQFDPKTYEQAVQMQEFGDLIKEKGSLATNPYYKKDFVTSVLPQALGSGIMFYGAGLAGRLAKMPTYLLPLMSAALPQATKGYEDAKQSGADEETAMTSFFINMGLGATEVLPVIHLFKKLDKRTGGGASKVFNKKMNDVLKIGVEQGIEEVIQEVSSQYFQNLTAKQLYDTSRDLTEGLVEGGAAGLIVGFFMGSAGVKIQQLLESKNTSKEDKDLLNDLKLGIDEIARQVQNPQSNFAEEYYRQTDQSEKLQPPTRPADTELGTLTISPEGVGLEQFTDLTPEERQKAGLPQTDSFENDQKILNNLTQKIARGEKDFTPEELQLQKNYPNYVEASLRTIKESPEFKQEQTRIRQQEKQKVKLDNDNYSNLTRQFKNAQRKRNLFDTDILRQGITEITTPEAKAKAEQLLAEAEKHNTNLVKRNEFTIENLSRKKYGTTDLNSLPEEKQQSLLNEYNEMKKQGITEFKQIQSTIPIIEKGEPDAIQIRPSEEILQRQPEEIREAGSERGGIQPSIERQEVTEAEEEGFIKRPGEEETRILKPKVEKQPYELTQQEYVNQHFEKPEVKKEMESPAEKGRAIRESAIDIVSRQKGEEHKKLVQQAIEEGKIKSHPDYPELTKKAEKPVENNEVAIKRMLEEGKTPEDIASALKVPIEEVKALAPKEPKIREVEAEKKPAPEPTEKKSEKPSIIDDDMKNLIKDIEKGLEGITYQLKKPDAKKETALQLKPGEKIPSDIQTKANELIGKFIDKGITKFDDVIKNVDGAFGEQTLQKIFPALKAGYTAYLTNATDAEAEKMDSFDIVRKFTLEKPEGKPAPKDAFADIKRKPEEPVLVDRKFIQRVREEIRSGNVLTKTQLENIAKEYGIIDPNIAKEQAELAIVAEARKIINETKDEKEAYDKIVELYKNQPNLTHRTNESVEKQQYSTPAPISYAGGLYVADGVGNGDVLEPSAGNGMLVIAFNTGQVYVNEIDAIRNANLRQSEYEGIANVDAEKNDNIFGKKFDGIITNPPFGSAEEKKFNDYKLNKLEHIMAANALKQMQKDGRAAIIIGGHNRYDNKGRLQNDRTFFNWLYHHYNVDAVLNIDGELYKKQGTQFPIRLILINGKKEISQGASPLYDANKDAVVKDFEELYNKVKEIRDETLLRSQADAKPGISDITDVRGPKGEGIQKPGRTETIPKKPSGEIDAGKPTKPGGIGRTDIRPSGKGEPLPEQPSGISGTDIGKPTIPGSIKPKGGERGEIESGRSPEDIQRSFDREPAPTITRADLESNKPNVPYKPQSKGTSLETVIPRNMSYETFRQLQQLTEDVGGDIDQFVVDKLQYKDKDELFSHLGAEQIDATAMAIVSIEKNQGMVIGDMAGVGKGRIATSIIRYSVLNGYKPMFFTEKPRLYSDLYRDMKDTGNKDLKPFIVNDTPNANITDAEGEIVYAVMKDDKKRKALADFNIGDSDYIVSSYSQIQNEASVAKKRFISELAQDNIIIMDESHNASGEGNTSDFFKSLVQNAKGVTYLSATFAKRPDNMPIYAVKTAMNEANLSETQLVEAIEKGGVALQEILSTDLVEAQQMLRREKSYDGIKIGYKPLVEKKAEHTKIADATTEIIRDIINFQNEYVKPNIDIMDTVAAAEGERVGVEQGTSNAGVDNTPFANKVFNVIDQLLFSLKADSAAEEAIRLFKQNKKPVIAVKNTMESFLDYTGVQVGDILENTDFSSVLERGLKGVFRIRIRDAEGNSVPDELSINALTDAGRKEYKRLLDKINSTAVGITISPIDHMIYKLNKAGYKVGEITGRKIQLKFRDDGKAIVEARTEKDINKIFRDFNNWENPGTPRGKEGYTDIALMVNASGSTGASAHSSPSFKDQRQRVMITAQIELNINTEVQKRGRINRTGQINDPEYITLASAIPAEQRLLMMAKKKLKSLDANVSSDQSQAGTTFEANDFLNKYGDEIVIEYLKENREMNDMLLDPFKMNQMQVDELDKFTRKENASHKATGRVAILPTHLQEEFYKEIGERYDDHIRYLDSIGENDLEVKILPLESLTTNSRLLVAGKGGKSPFGRDSILETAEVNVLQKPYRMEKVNELLENYLEGKGKSERKKQLLNDFEVFWKGWTETHLERRKDVIAKDLKISKDELNSHLKGGLSIEDMLKKNPHLIGKEAIIELEFTRYSDLVTRFIGQADNVANNIIGRYSVGDVYKVPLVRDNVSPIYSNGIFLGWHVNPKRKNPYAPSAIILKFIVADSRRIVELPASKRDWLNDITSESYSLSQWQKNDIIQDWDDSLPDHRREVKHIVTGNILQAFGGNDIKGGQLISYTTKEGGLKRGILVKDVKSIIGDEARVPIKKAKKFIQQLDMGDFIESAGGEVTLTNQNNRNWIMEVPASKKRGGKYYLDEGIKKLVRDGRFDKWGNVMRGEFKRENLDKMIDLLQDDFGISVRLSQDQIKKMGDEDISYQLVKGKKVYKDDFGNDIPVKFSSIHEYQQDSKILDKIDKFDVEFSEPKIVYWTREKIKSYDYTDDFVETLPKLEKGDFGYEPRKDKFAVEIAETNYYDTETGRWRITVSSRATPSAYAEGIIHQIQRSLEKISPEMARKISEWESNLREVAEAGGLKIPQGLETFTQAMVFTHLGYASENPDIAELYEIPTDIYKEFIDLLNQSKSGKQDISDLLFGTSQRGQIRLPSGNIDNSLVNYRAKRERTAIPSEPIDKRIEKGQELYSQLKSELGATADVYPEWRKQMRTEFGKEFDNEARKIWKEMKDVMYQLKPASKELIEKVKAKGLEIDKNLIATHKIKGEAKDYITVSTPDRAVTKMIEVENLDEGLKKFSTKKRSETLSPEQILSNSYGLYPTPMAIKDAQEILGDRFNAEFEKFKAKIKEQNIKTEGEKFEMFARRVITAKRLGVDELLGDKFYEVYEKSINTSKEQSYQLKKPKKDRVEGFTGKKLESEIAREKGLEPESGEGNIVDFGAGLGNVFTATADKISEFARNNKLEKEFNIENDPKLQKLYREFLTAPQWFFDKEPQLKRVWDIIDRHFVRNVNEEIAILKEDKWKNGKTWRNLTDLEKKEFLSALEEHEQTQYELQRDGEPLELLDWADFADEFALTPRATDFLFTTYKPVVETALDMVKDVDRYKIINETKQNPYLELYYEAREAKLRPERLQAELEKAREEFFNDDPNSEALYENELATMIRKKQPIDEVKALKLTWVNNPNLRETLAEVLVDKKYERIDGKVYFPSSRLDKKYYLSAIKKTTPEEKLLEGKYDDRYFTTADNLSKLATLKDNLETQGYTTKVGKFADAQEEILQNAVTQEDILDLAISAGVDQDNPILERLVKTIQAKGFSRHFIPKRFIPGFEYTGQNFETALFKYMNSVPFYKNRTIGEKELAKTLAELKHRGILKPGSANDRYIQDLKTKIENRDVKLSQALRAVASTYYLALSPAYLSQQIVQPLNTLLPYLPIATKELGLKPIEAEKAFGEALYSSIGYWAWKVYDKANRTLGRPTKSTFGLDRDFLYTIRSLERQGVGKPLRSMELAGYMVDPTKYYSKDIFSKGSESVSLLAKIAGAPGIAIEDFTRTIGIRALYTLGKKAGLTGDKLLDFISSGIAKSYGPASGRLAKPPGYYIAGEGRMKPMKEISQSVIESWLTFKNFAFMNFGQWGKIWRVLKEDTMFRPVAYKLGAQIGLAGLKYIMWAATILTMISGLIALSNKFLGTGIVLDPEEEYEGLFKHFNKLIPGLGDALYRGVASLTFKVDLSALFAQTAPIEEPFTKDVIQLIGGAPASAIKDIVEGRAPRVARGFQITKRWEEEGVTMGSRKLIKPEDITEEEKILRKLGYNPLKIAEAYQQENTRQFKSKQYTDKIRKTVEDEIIPLIEKGKGKEAREIFKKFYEDMKEDNILTENQKKSISGVNSFISQVVLTRLNTQEREIIKKWKNSGTYKPSGRSISR